MVEVGRDLWRSSCPILPAQAGPSRASCQDRVQIAFEYLQGWRLHTISFHKVIFKGYDLRGRLTRNRAWGKGPHSLSACCQLCTLGLRMEHWSYCPAAGQQTLPKEAVGKARNWFQRLWLHYQVAHCKRRGSGGAEDCCSHHIHFGILRWTTSSLVSGSYTSINGQRTLSALLGHIFQFDIKVKKVQFKTSHSVMWRKI